MSNAIERQPANADTQASREHGLLSGHQKAFLFLISLDEAVATRIWREINARHLRENILPTRERANLILEKSSDHKVRRVRLRKR